MLLAELGTSVTKLSGVGPAVAGDLHNLGVYTIRDLLLLLPRDYEDRQSLHPLQPDRDGQAWVNTIAEVVAHDYFPFQGKLTLKIMIRDEHGSGSLVCFGRNFLARKLQVGQRHHICGSFAMRYGEFQCTAFDSEPAGKTPQRFGRILPIYPLAGSLQQGRLRSILERTLQQYGDNLDSSLPQELYQDLADAPPDSREADLTGSSSNSSDGTPVDHSCATGTGTQTGRSGGTTNCGTGLALRFLHAPPDLACARAGRQALAYEELFLLQARIAQAVAERKNRQRPPRQHPETLLQALIDSLPFALTPDQQQAVTEIRQDLNSTTPMRRLLHGDVGSGKTLTALCSALPVLEDGGQTVLLVPTELLAQQHTRTVARLLQPLGIASELLTGSLAPAERVAVLERIRSGAAQFICATHAAFSSDVEYASLEYIIVDEQHRFGVEQRQALIHKAVDSANRRGPAEHRDPDVLFMTATPIPRTLALTVFGDLSVSAIRSMPAGRLPIRTHLARMGNEQKVYDWVRAELQNGRQAYFVYPLIRESAKLSIRDAESMAARLATEVFPEYSLGLIHSRTPADQKAATMQDFHHGRIRILAATSVVEVGVDVPNATCMVIEHAERFGLAALHQLRGRVGRGNHQSYCFLVYAEPLTEEAKQRIMVMKQHTDGFEIAEEDLNIRGPGDLAGTRQAGFLRLRAARLPRDMEIMNRARQDAFRIIEADPLLEQPGHACIRRTLQCESLLSLESEGEEPCA
ncbi:ATP-dependent DNA helicase RecG [Spirochaeta africana]|uniref:Probable DNA 3'-5' helicase RecG n=1 Tax=Spirochaeta africana (strain ATCC 700263 / DSM 8902 / Z-7692) TaxID=889378 RepID=H9UL70_SPIAZ|nr:ATP-dependent DNA helicase RecG [Spirochaeta africana]AFG38263.1 RecG-like helicase [Spirochaeta africana DSM 8902]